MMIHRLMSMIPLLLAGTLHAQPADIFPRIPFDQAVAQAEAAGQPVMLYVSVEWAQSERQMRRTTWTDRGLRELVRSRVAPIYIDADANPTAAQEVDAIAFPTIVLISPDGERIGRPLVGFRTVEQMESWLRGNLGERVANEIRADSPSVTNLPATLLSAVERERNGETDRALEFLGWCWQNISQLDSSTAAARRTFVAKPMASLADRYEPANDAFSQLRDQVQARLETSEFEWEDLRDWIVLNDIVGETDRTLDWVRDRVAQDQIEILRRLEPELLPILLDEREVELLEIVAPEPRPATDRLIKNLSTLRGSDITGLNDAVRDFIIDLAADLYAATLAQGRDNEANELAKLIVARVGDPDGTRILLIRKAIEWDQPRETHRDWLGRLRDPSKGNQVIGELEAAL